MDSLSLDDAITAGAHARVHGLKGRPDLNGAEVLLLRFEAAAGRWQARSMKGEGIRKHIRDRTLRPPLVSNNKPKAVLPFT